MIELKQVTKRYGTVEAVRNLSFIAPEGQIIGLLGQNGAGKTTTLNMLTGYFPPTSGQVLVDGMDMLLKPRECKRRIGYLPERPPLYDAMTTADYLTFVCRLREVREKAIRPHITAIMETCGEYGIPVLNLHDTDFDWRKHTSDGCHPNPEGHRWICEKILETGFFDGIRNL